MKMLHEIFDAYLRKYPDETTALERLRSLLETYDPTQWIDRKNFTGHATASAFILDADARNLLMIHHRFLNRWLQPGGHIDAADPNPMAAAQREVHEEVGLPTTVLHAVAMDSDRPIPFDIDSHSIPANPKKAEAAHWHHDFRYLFQLKGESDLAVQPEEIVSCRWMPLTELAEDVGFARVSAKLRTIVLPQNLP
jgi:8-oxo-dGTP pyrophosphatase MutT (NUDIX family)